MGQSLDIKQLETFYWVARLGGITEAGKRLNATQSTLSMRLKALEADLRVTLFDRSHKRLKLTAKGRDLVRYAERMLETAEQVRVFVADPATESGTLRVGAAELVALTWASDLIHHLNAQFPSVVLELDVGLPLPLFEGLAQGKFDVVLAPSVSKPSMPFVGLPLGSVGFSWMASPSLGLGRRKITPVDLEKLPIIGAARNQSILDPELQRWFADHNASIRRLNVCNNLSASAVMVMAGVGVSLLPDDYFAPLIESGKLEVLKTNRTFGFDYYAIRSALGDQALPGVVAELARKVSTFTRGKPPRRGIRTAAATL